MRLVIPDSEIYLSFVASGGKGGQNVNKVATKVQLSWNIENSRVFSTEQKERLLKKLKNHINWKGDIVLFADSERSQIQNRVLALKKLHTLVSRALIIPKKRTPTRPTRASKRRRLEGKILHSHKKQTRKGVSEYI